MIASSILGDTTLYTTSFLILLRVQAPSELNPRRASFPAKSEACCHQSKKTGMFARGDRSVPKSVKQQDPEVSTGDTLREKRFKCHYSIIESLNGNMKYSLTA
jgi:hypothetical protein